MRHILAVILIFQTLVSIAQPTPKQLLTLKDGSRISGIILSDSSGILKVNEIKSNIVYIEGDRVASIDKIIDITAHKPIRSGYFIHLKTSLLAGKNELGDAYTASFQIANGYQFGNGLSAGAGVGIEHLGVPVIPVYGDFQYFLLNNRLSPFLYLRTGYGFALSEIVDSYYYDSNRKPPKGGLMFNGGVGIALYSWPNAAVTVGLGYRYQRVTLERYEYWWGSGLYREIITDFNRIEFQVGFIFK
jgi:hypothetical protein